MNIFNSIITQELKQIRDVASQFASDRIQPHVIEWEEAEWFPKSLHKEAGALGLLGVGFPEEVGGAGGGALHTVMVLEGLMTCGSTGVVVGLSSVGIAVPPIIAIGDEAQIDRFVRPALSGDLCASLAISEPGTGSDVAGIKTHAVKQDDAYVLNGSKLFITSGKRADFFTTLVRTSEDPHAGLTLFIVESSMPGVSVSRTLKKTGWRASDTVEISFEDVRIPMSHRVGPEGAGFLLTMQNFQMERLALAAYGAITAELCYREAKTYASQRQAFGRSLSGFQVTRHKLAEMATRTLAARNLVYQVAAAIDRGEDVVSEVSMAKNFCADVAQFVSYEAVQIFGGMGYMRESVVERLSRDARLLPIGGGTQEIMRELIAKKMR